MTETSDVVATMEAASRRLDETRLAVEEHGTEELREVADALQNVERVLDRYESRATDRDDLKGYIEFREALSDTLDEIPADIRHSEAFIEVNDILTTGITSTLSEKDFEQARIALEPVREDAERLVSWRTARSEYQSARHAVEQRRRELTDRLDELEEITALGDADLEAPTDELALPIEAYNDAVTTTFTEYVQRTPSREVLALLVTAESYPLVELPTPPQRLRSYLETADVGSEPVSRLVELADFSRSKLEHYVSDPETFSAAVGTNRTFLSQLTHPPDSLTISWPPESAQELTWRARELTSIVGRFADEATVQRLRAVHRFASNNSAEFNRLRATAVAHERLTETQLSRLKTGAIETEREECRAVIRRLAECLESHEPLH
ncbi:hypothetical protein ACFQJC_06320 [Haloferax namakaokahaiae]|uniref:Uncharacterized protein n=1 Tax=Haloferax namakaokahaiae TaxID=1748331 RepID=A0ABD5ZD23_9EURY